MCGTARSGQHEFRNETLSDRKFKKSIVCKGITGINKNMQEMQNKLAKAPASIYNTRKNQIQEESHVIRR